MNGETKNYKKYIGKTTNNQAEYYAVLLALDKARSLGVETIDMYLDSELVCQQLKQKYKVKDKDLAALFVRVWNIMLAFKKVTFTHVRRNENREADRLVNEAIDER